MIRNSRFEGAWSEEERWCVHCSYFFSSRRRHTRLQGDWSSDVCSSDLTSLVGGRSHLMPSSSAAPSEPGLVSTWISGFWDFSRSASLAPTPMLSESSSRSEERRVGKECRSRWSPYH